MQSAALAQAQQGLTGMGSSASGAEMMQQQGSEEEALQRAMALSLAQQGGAAGAGATGSSEEDDLQLALRMSRSIVPGDPSEADPVMDQSNVTR